MMRRILLAVMTCICQLFSLRGTALAFDDEQLVRKIRTQGVLEFVRHTMDISRALQYVTSEQQQEDVLEYVAKHTQGPLKEVRASTTYSTPNVECTVVETVDEAFTNILVLLRVNEREDSTFDLAFTNLNSSSISGSVERVYQVLENTEMDASVIDLTRGAIDNMIKKGDVQFFDDLEKNLASRARALPTYVPQQLPEQPELSRRRRNEKLDIFRTTSDARYLVTKKLLGNHVVASYGVPTSFGPLIFSVHFLLLDTGPVVCSSWFEGGVAALPYINDYRRGFSSEPNPSGQRLVK